MRVYCQAFCMCVAEHVWVSASDFVKGIVVNEYSFFSLPPPSRFFGVK